MATAAGCGSADRSGVRRTAVTSVERADPPERLEGIARVGRTEARVAWTLREQRDGGTEVRLAATVMRAGALDRAVLALGGASWMRRLFAATLAHLATRFATEASVSSRLRTLPVALRGSSSMNSTSRGTL